MERHLNILLEDLYHCDCSYSPMIVQIKGLSLFNDLKKEQGSCAERESFVASCGWFERFRDRSNLGGIVITAESASADKEPAAIS